MNKLRRYRVEIILALLLLISVGVYFYVNNKSEESGSDVNNGLEDGLYPEDKQHNEQYNEEEFYAESGRIISKTDFLNHQVGTIGDTIIFTEPGQSCFEYDSPENRINDLVMNITLNRVTLSEQFRGESEEGYKYLTLHYVIENLHELPFVFGLVNFRIHDYIEGEDYLHADIDASRLQDLMRICEVYTDIETRGVVENDFRDPKPEDGIIRLYLFNEPGDPKLVYLEKGKPVSCKLVCKVEKEKIDANERSLVFTRPYSSRYTTTSFVFVIPPEKIEKVENIE